MDLIWNRALSNQTEEQHLSQIRALSSDGNFLEAYDSAQRALSSHPSSRLIQHRVVLLLAQMGALENAERRFLDFKLHEWDHCDGQALRARLEKDRAYLRTATGDKSREEQLASGHAFLRVALLYETVYRKQKKKGLSFCYPGVNAATFYLIASDKLKVANSSKSDDYLNKSKRIAEEISKRAISEYEYAVQILDNYDNALPEDDFYFKCATVAELYLILNKNDEASVPLQKIAHLHPSRLDAYQSFYRQVSEISKVKQIEVKIPFFEEEKPTILLTIPGHFKENSDENQEDIMALTSNFSNCKRLITSLTSKYEVDLAEKLIGIVPFDVVLPFKEKLSRKLFLDRHGLSFTARRDNIIEQLPATSFRSAWSIDEETSRGEQIDFSIHEYLIGLAELQSRVYCCSISQISPSDSLREKISMKENIQHYAIIFCDLTGFSSLKDKNIEIFHEKLLTPIARSIEKANPYLVNTWGDGIFLVFKNVVEAAFAARDIRNTVCKESSLNSDLAGFSIRIGCNWGPATEIVDPLTERRNLYGITVNTAARIEPVTQAGQIWVTESFATALILKGEKEFNLTYLGRKVTAKDFGTLFLYELS